ncbi:MAG: PspA/IM30 family protein [Acidobacteriota bacterium]|nr:PspA/IM30 family protein [Acidobacteriota bacterium]
MMDVLRKRWAYFGARSNSRFEEKADPKIQLEQAIAEAQDQHRRLVEQAANVVANQKQHELQLNRAMEELEKINRSTRQALMMAEEAEKAGDQAKAREYNQTAEAFANRLIATENQVNDLKTLSLQSAQAADQARSAVQQNSLALQQKLAERQKLLSQLDQAKMQEQLNSAMNSLSSTVDQTAPSLDQVRSKIEARYARAIGASELGGQTVEARMLEVEQASMGSEARSRLDSIRAEMSLGPGRTASGELGAGTPSETTASPQEQAPVEDS